MKRFFTITLLITTLGIANTFAFSSNLFEVDAVALENEFAELNQLERYVSTNNMLNLNEAKKRNEFDFSRLNQNTVSETGTGSSEFVFQWDGFLWGFLCCPIGCFVVAVNKEKTKDQKTSYWIGVAAGTVLNALVNIAVYGSPMGPDYSTSSTSSSSGY